eukprot:2729778-Prorocentrum_lima.AAC.1
MPSEVQVLMPLMLLKHGLFEMSEQNVIFYKSTVQLKTNTQHVFAGEHLPIQMESYHSQYSV